MSKISIIIPAYNEEVRIGKTLENHLNYFNDVEIFITMDGCKDRTLDIVKLFTEKGNINNNSVSYIHFDKRLGKGMGILNAIDHTKGDILVITDADLSTSPSEIFKLIKELDGYDCIIGSRWLSDSIVTIKQPLRRRIASRTFNFLIRHMFGLPFRDTQCGAKVFRKKIIKNIKDDMTTFNYAFDIDLLLQLHRKGFKIKEIPIIWNDKDGSSIKLFHTTIAMFFAIIRLKVINSSLKFIVRNHLIGYLYNIVRKI